MWQNRVGVACFCIGVFFILVGQSWSAISLGTGYLSIEQVILLLMVPLLLFRNKKGIGEKERVIQFLVFGIVLWLSLANVIFKSPVYENLREIKNNILVIALAYLLCVTIVSDREGWWWVIKAVVLGGFVFMIMILPQIDFASSLTRQIDDSDFVEMYGVSYIWIGYISGVTIIFCVLLTTTSKQRTRIFWLVPMTCGVVFLLFSGTRAAIIGLPLSVLFVFAISRIKTKIAIGLFAGVLIILVSTILCAGMLSDILPDPPCHPAAA